MAWFTFGEGYHNFHHEFQHDYRNGVKPWQFDPTKWCIWLLAKFGLAGELRRVSIEKVMLAQIAEQERQMAAVLSQEAGRVPAHLQHMLHVAQSFLHQAATSWEQHKAEYRRAAELRMDASREKVAELRRNLEDATAHFREAVRRWQNTRRLVLAHLG
jgi:stearoyl-CoA desaturase (delta-9 desaturase)